ncbi:MAG: hypothetical protein ABEJ40_07615 [Haloarculaceae archaeon]
MSRTDPSGESGLSTNDAVLAAIPAWLLVAAAAAVPASVSVGTALAVGSLPASGTIGYALFYDPPTVGDGEN